MKNAAHPFAHLGRLVPQGLILATVVVSLVGWIGAVSEALPPAFEGILDWSSGFATVFLGIFIEAVPFLLLGTLASGLVEVFFDSEALARMLPGRGLSGALTGGLLGLFFPVCECGVVPLARRLVRKGLPRSAAVAFLLAAPVINPIVIASTLTAFGPGWLFWGRLALTLAIAVLTGWLFSKQDPSEPFIKMLPVVLDPPNTLIDHQGAASGLGGKTQRMLVIAAGEFFEMGRFLVMGAFLAALMQSLVPQPALLAIGRGPFLSVAVMSLLAVMLSVCSTVDAFIALAFSGVFTTGSILAFLVYGPMVDIKSVLMLLRVFPRRTVAYLVALPFVVVLLVCVAWNFVWPW